MPPWHGGGREFKSHPVHHFLLKVYEQAIARAISPVDTTHQMVGVGLTVGKPNSRILSDTKDALFLALANRISVSDIQTPLGPELGMDEYYSEAAGQLMDEGIENGYEAMDRISLVSNGERVVGYVFYEDLLSDVVEDCMESFSPDMIMTEDTTILEAIERFAADQRFYFLVLGKGGISGSVHYTDLFKLPGRLCFFALTLEIEQLALDLLLLESNESWRALRKSRQKIAHERWLKNSGKNSKILEDIDYEKTVQPWWNLLQSTSLIDKKIILARRNLLPAHLDLEDIFTKIERVRNSCAHVESERYSAQVLVHEEIVPFVVICLDFMSHLRKSYDEHRTRL